MKRSSWIKRILRLTAILFIVANIIAAIHAYKFTHFTEDNVQKTSTEPGFWENVSLIFSGVDNPRPENSPATLPDIQTVVLEGEHPVNCWYIESDSAIGSVVICHGYGGCKSSMMDKAEQFLNMHYNVLVPDFMGCGDSDGNQCTIGFYEAEQVKQCYDYLDEQKKDNIILYGTSMGAVAIMKALNDYELNADAAILECPFGSMYATTCARFELMNMPSFPMAGLLVFWGGLENGFWAFDHNPTDYAKKIRVPVLLMYGEQDPKVSREEIDEIYSNLTAGKKLVTFAEAGHENYFNQYRLPWIAAVTEFLNNHNHVDY
jgi:pimeloyl-ACP methyl ester carboxylesterase